MTQHSWTKFWFSDWQRDPALRSCSLASRGLWMEMLCIAHDGTPYGFVVINGKPATTKQIASIVGSREKEVSKLLEELENAGVFSRDDAGAIYSRRMVRDNLVREKSREHGKAGGNPSLRRPLTPPEAKVITGGLTPPLKHQEAEAESEIAKPSYGSGTPRDPMSTGMVGIYPGKNGAPHAAGWDLDVVFNRLTAAAGMPDPAATGLTYGPLVQWLCDGYEPSDIAALIERRAATAGYRPPRTLSYFDKPVRQELRRGKVWVDLEGKPITA